MRYINCVWEFYWQSKNMKRAIMKYKRVLYCRMIRVIDVALSFKMWKRDEVTTFKEIVNTMYKTTRYTISWILNAFIKSLQDISIISVARLILNLKKNLHEQCIHNWNANLKKCLKKFDLICMGEHGKIRRAAFPLLQIHLFIIAHNGHVSFGARNADVNNSCFCLSVCPQRASLFTNY